MPDMNKKRSRAQKGGRAAAQSPTRQYPLRAVMGRDYVTRVETLECGHTMLPRQDMIGDTYPTRRRCAKCAREQRQDASVAQKPQETTETFTLDSKGGIDTRATVYRENGVLLTVSFSPIEDRQHSVTLNSDELAQLVHWWLDTEEA